MILRYSINSYGEPAKKEEPSVFVRQGRLYTMFANAHIPKDSIDFVIIDRPNCYNDWLVYPCKAVVPADSPELVKLKEQSFSEKEKDFYASFVQDRATGQWYYESVFLMFCERNYIDGNYIRMKQIGNGSFPLAAFVGMMKEQHLSLLSMGSHDYEDTTTFLNYASEVAFRDGSDVPKPCLDVYSTFCKAYEDYPMQMPYTNEMMIWAYYRFGVQSVYSNLYSFYQKVTEWLRDRNLPYRATFDKLAGSITLTGGGMDPPQSGTFFVREGDNKETVVLLQDGSFAIGDDVWEFLERSIQMYDLFRTRLYYFGEPTGVTVQQDRFLAEVKEAYRPKPDRPRVLRRVPSTVRPATDGRMKGEEYE